MYGLTPRELAALRRLDTPERVQAYLDRLPYNTEPDGDTVTFSLPAGTSLPNGTLDMMGRLSFLPAPAQLGTYNFMIDATDGKLTVRYERPLSF